MDGWMNKKMDERNDRFVGIDKWMNEWIYGWMNGRIEDWMDE